MRLQKRRMVIFLLGVIMTFCEYIILSFMNISAFELNDVFTFFAAMVLGTIIIQILLLKINGIDFSSPIMLFLLFCHIFHFGQVLTTNIYDFEYTNYVSTYMSRDMETLRKTLVVCLVSMNFTFLGCLFCSSIQVKSLNLQESIDENAERTSCLAVGKGLFFVSTPFRFYQDIRQLLAALTLGYKGAIGIKSISGVFGAIGGFWYSSIIFLYIGCRNKKYLWMGIIYSALTMLTGNRGHQLTNIIMMLLVYIHVEHIKPSLKQIIKYGVLGYFSLLFVDMIMNFRGIGITHFLNNISYYLTESIHTNIVLETIGSFGETIFTPFLVIKQMHTEIEPVIGEAWLCSILTIIPNIGGITTYTNLHSNYPKMLVNSHAIGGSYIGDLYYNFQEGYWVVSFIIGFLLCYAALNFKSAITSKKYTKLIIYIPVFYNSFWWVRDSFGNLMRPLVWQIILSIIILNIYKNKTRGGEYEKRIN